MLIGPFDRAKFQFHADTATCTYRESALETMTGGGQHQHDASGKPCRACDDLQSDFAAKVMMSGGAAPRTQKKPAAAAGSASPSASASAPSASASSASTPVECPLDRQALGRASWGFLHSTAAYYSDQPSEVEQQQMKELVRAVSSFYPCGYCAEHLREYIKEKPPVTTNRRAFSLWMCQMVRYSYYIVYINGLCRSTTMSTSASASPCLTAPRLTSGGATGPRTAHATRHQNKAYLFPLLYSLSISTVTNNTHSINKLAAAALLQLGAAQRVVERQLLAVLPKLQNKNICQQ